MDSSFFSFVQKMVVFIQHMQDILPKFAVIYG